MTVAEFRNIVWSHYRTHGRHTLPWRKTHTAYSILVSEVMLQQTQVERVIPYYRAWMRKYPTVHALARAPLAEVLTSWQGLGYNRRAKMLRDAARCVVELHNGRMPRTVEELEQLPGVGPYTARAVAAFAYNQDVVCIETNIRTVVTHHFFADQSDVSDTEILSILTRALPHGRAREWYAALMDYGAHLKQNGVRINAKRKGYVKQSAFEGSARQVRGGIIRALTQKAPMTAPSLRALFPPERASQVDEQLAKLTAEGLLTKHGRGYALP